MITKVETNLKAGANVALGPKTLVVGPNRSGKSTIVNAVELATTGRASDVAGRVTLALDAELATLIPPGEESGFARAWLTDGRQIAWSLTKGKKATRGAIPAPVPAVHFPLRAVRENLTASPATARKWLLDRLASDTPWANVLARVAGSLHDKLTTLAGGSVLGLPTAIEVAAKKVREATQAAATLRAATPAATISVATVAPGPDLGALEAAVEAAKMKLETARKAVAALPPAASSMSQTAQAMQVVLRGQIAAKAKACGICAMTPAEGSFEKRLVAVEAVLRAAGEEAMKRQAVQAAVALAESEVRTAEWALRSATDAAKAVATAVEDTVTATVQANESRAVELEREAAEWDALKGAAERAMNGLVDAAKAAFEARVQAFMPAGMPFGLDLRDGEREVTRFGLRQPDGSVRSALSGAEWAIVTVALAGAVAEPGALSIIVPEERAFDADTLSAALVAFGGLSAQVIVTSPVMPTTVPEGWTVISTGALPAAVALPATAAQGPVTAPPPAKRGPGRPRGARNKKTAEPAPTNGTNGADGFQGYVPPRPCPGCGVDLNIEGVMHSQACDGGKDAAKGTASASAPLPTDDDAPPFM